MTRQPLAFPKPTRLKSPPYLAWIRQQHCLGCGAQAQAHHTTSKGSGGSDFRSVPLCWRCHRELHHRGGSWFQEKYHVDFTEEVIRLMETYLSALKDGEDVEAR